MRRLRTVLIEIYIIVSMMQPVSLNTVSEPIRRSDLSLARELGKRVDIIIDGGDIMIESNLMRFLTRHSYT